MSEVDSDRPSCLELHGRELLEDLVPDGAHHVLLTSAVDSLNQFPRYWRWSLGMCAWNAQSGMKTRKEYHESSATSLTGAPCFPKASLSHLRDLSGVPGRGMKPVLSLLIVGIR